MSDFIPTPEERRNGWTEESLRAYWAQRERAAALVIQHDPDARKPAQPKIANSKYSPFRWRS